MMKRIGTVVLLVGVSLAMISCAKPHVGKRINTHSSGFCRYAAIDNNGEKRCLLRDGHLVFDFSIKKGEREGEYIIDGTMDPSQGDLASISHLVPAKSRFNLLVIRDGVIVDNVGFRPRAGFGNTDRPWPFTINLDMPEGLDGVTLTYFISVRG